MLLPKLKLRLLSEQDSPTPRVPTLQVTDREARTALGCGERAGVMDPLYREATWSHLNTYKHTIAGMGMTVQTVQRT